jgi:hypothetical protein
MPTKDEMNTFALLIEALVLKTKVGYVDAIVDYCAETGLEIEVAATLVNQNLKSKIESDAADRNMFKEKSARLPI